MDNRQEAVESLAVSLSPPLEQWVTGNPSGPASDPLLPVPSTAIAYYSTDPS